ncbi:SDR family NAD(P)-dependent oxidoreductase [Paenibacillus elgii]|uniref:SDR family NAD(P)-dependent oxidoreductase n=1 Tax=Paenibacillus elgii TaxID=189691 RepID=UPI0020406A1B|nr:SDR family NAD(P)-dependent oxidoreductase [Paenibacillus elgii]MCM3269689.1 SDR family NAD(P)-dependent oxidoreductase [Paenibacillus elgii]
MKEQLSLLYNQIKQGRISHENAAEQLQSLLSAADDRRSVPAEPEQGEDEVLRERAVHYLKKLLAAVIMLPERQIEADAPLEQYGIDSVMVMKLTDQLETVFGPLPKTLFFEYHHIQDLTGYFLRSHRSKLTELLGTPVGAPGSPAPDRSVAPDRHSESGKKERFRQPAKGRRLAETVPAQSAASKAVSSTAAQQSPEIAIIGLSGRYPGATNIHEYWDNLKNGKDCITEIPQSRWNDRIHAGERQGGAGAPSGERGGFLEGVDRFDPLFFHISPREAERIDPQERLFLECVYETLEDAGYTRETVAGPPGTESAGSAGVFVGVMYQEYQLYGAEAQLTGKEPFALNGNPASIANRVSYFCNFHGPSMVVDTMCSSSLTAIHLACQSLQKGECAVAVAGGVNVSVHPNKYVMLTQGGFLSSKGRCESFGEGGDGYVPGEGVGAILLKPLAKAVADGDRIYGVIKGTAVNHGGKTNGYTVPNPNRQASVISRAIQEAGIHPRRISYIEAHGTGTSLGDPIEIAGLTKAFGAYTQDTGFCAIGSAKSNIGHCESAAGIAGVTKVLLQMKYGQLVPSIHAQRTNANIDFDQTPFVVQQKLGDWERPAVEIDGVMIEAPRIAGISSFGAGGSNAHVVIEEYVPGEPAASSAPAQPDRPAMIVLSARNDERLRALASRLLAALREQRYADRHLADMAYTLQTGREAMEARLGMLVESIADLTEKLEHFMEGRTSLEGIYSGQAKSSQEPLLLLSSDDDMQGTILQWVRKGKYGKLLELWVNGLRLDWTILHQDGARKRIGLPTYPFARERCWVPEYEKKAALSPYSGAASAVGASYLHPLLHRNISDLMEQKYTSTFTGNEFFLADHVVKGRKVLPAAAHLEMARVAVENALGGLAPERSVVSLRQIAWTKPIGLEDEDEPIEVSIAIRPGEDDGEIRYEILARDCSQQAEEPVLSSFGSAVILEYAENADSLSVDLAEVRSRCSLNTVSKEACYQAYDELGLHYGHFHQALDTVYVGQDEALASLKLHSALEDDQARYVLHPATIDAALQASIGLWLGTGHEGLPMKQPAVPFALERLDVFRPCASSMWAYVRYSEGSRGLNMLQKLDIDICDDSGGICVRIQGVSSRIWEGEHDAAMKLSAENTLLLVPEWKARDSQTGAPASAYDRHFVMLCEPYADLKDQIAVEMNGGATCIALAPEDEMRQQPENSGIEQRFRSAVLRAFGEIRRLIRHNADGADGKILIQTVVANEGQLHLLSALSGLLRTAVLENPKLSAQLIEVDPGMNASQIAALLKENGTAAEMHIRYSAGKRYEKSWNELPLAGKRTDMPWRDGGVYLITGGTGGLGLIFAREIAAKAHRPVLILTGRSELSGDKLQELNKLEQAGAQMVYRQSDVADRQAVSDLMKHIRQNYGKLNGIIHSAGIVRDNFILKKREAEAEEVLTPKVCGTVHLDEASRDMQLDFFVLFSSLAGMFGNPGQADYAAANAFMDSYAHYRSELAASGRRHGKTLALNWPLWQEGGMRLEANAEQLLLHSVGMKAMTTETGLGMFYQAFHSDDCQVTVVHGRPSRLKEELLARWHGHGTRQERAASGPAAGDVTKPDLLHTLTHMAAGILHVAPEKLDKDVELAEYGFDQTMLAELASMMNRQFRLELTSAFFIEYCTLHNIANRLMNAYPGKFGRQVQVQGEERPRQGAEMSERSLTEQTASYLRQALASVLKLPSNQIEPDAPMENYGIDSIMVMQLTKQLESDFGTLSKTLLFEYQTIGALARYFVKSHRERLIELLGIPSGETHASVVSNASVATADIVKRTSRTKAGHRFASASAAVGPSAKPSTDIAIIGLAGRYPQANNLEQFWSNLTNAKDCITEIPQDRWDYRLYAGEAEGRANQGGGRWGGFLDDVDCFDPLFFNISPKEAELMDPQERLFLQTVYEALEDAGYTKDTLMEQRNGEFGNRVGVYVGVMYEEYQLYGAQAQALGHKPVALSGNPASIANRVSYFCNFHGPSMAVDTMCSSSLTAIHLACQSLQNEECEAAVAGGVNISVHPNKYIMLNQGGFLSSKGRCESFGSGGDGYVPGEGVGAVILKPLFKAVTDGDHIYGVIKASAINHGGKTNGYTVPNPIAQSGVIGSAIAKSGVDPRSISYMEAHGTGTALGDPIEITGLSKAFAAYTEDREFCAIGSVKSNIGHCESAAGIAGLTKVLLQMKHRLLVPSIHAHTLNPNIDFGATPFVVQRQLQEWKRPEIERNGNMEEAPRRAGISSFGAGGANAHLIIEEYRPSEVKGPALSSAPRGPAVIVLSAKTEERLQERAKQLLGALLNGNSDSAYRLTDIAFTLQTGREAMEERLGCLVHSAAELQEKLQAFISGNIQGVEGIYRGQVKAHKETMSLLASDEAWNEVVLAWFDQRAYGKLLELWVKGLQVVWSPLYAESVPRRISLPPYPFAKERCWAPQLGPSPGGSSEADDGSQHAVHSPLARARTMTFLHKRWQLSSAGKARDIQGTIAIVTAKENGALASELARYLAESVIWEEDELPSYLSEDLLSRLIGVIDLTGCAVEAEPVEYGEAMVHHGWLMWLQRWIETNKRDDATLLFVTSGLESFKNASVQLKGAGRAGLYRMLQSEYSRLRSRHMDVEPGTPAARLARQIVDEFLSESRDPEVCYRDGQRWNSYLSEADEIRSSSGIAGPFPRDQALWITGGTRGLGLLCARHFVQKHGITRLVLSGREPLPPREQWGLYAERAQRAEQRSDVAEKIKSVMELESQGVQVQVLAVDLTSEKDVREAVDHIRRTLGPVGGLIHCAGLVDGANPAFIRKTAPSVQRVMDPKVRGLHVLYDALLQEPLRFFALFSSVSSVIPALAVGQSDYAMANAYMDYFAEARAGDCPIVSIQWPSWKETGFGEVVGAAYKQTGLLTLTDAEGLQLLDRIVAGGMGPVVLPAVLDREAAGPDIGLNRNSNSSAPSASRERPTAASVNPTRSHDWLHGRTLAWLHDLLAQELKIDASRIDADTHFQQYGMDSILLAQVIVTMDRHLAGVSVDPSIILEHPTLGQLANHFVRAYPAELTTLFASSEHFVAAARGELSDRQPQHESVYPQSGKFAGWSPEEAATKVAVIGIGCHFPDAANPQQFWSNLKQGKDSMKEMPASRRLTARAGQANSAERMGAFLEDIEQFDPAYFGISEAQAVQLDPLQRQLLEVSVEAAADAGYGKKELWNTQTGVFVGARTGNFSSKLDTYGKETVVGIGQNFIAAHLSHFYNLKGPNMVMDTACSSSLTAIHLAVKSIQNGECVLAFAGGVDILLDEAPFEVLGAAGVLSPDARCKTFSADADGIGLGEGCGVVLLKPLTRAIADNDRIYGVIDGSAVNNDGHTMGITTPNPEAQKELLEQAIQDAGIHPETISYIETHGTGTLIGDPLELKALTGVFAKYTDGRQFCGVGSVKSNIGHLLSAAGIASFIKVLLSLVHRELPPTLHCDRPNPRFQFDDSPFYIVQTHQPWGDGDGVLRAGISAFGLGGNNAHLIISNEGIPASHMVPHPLTCPEVQFNRMRHWPDPAEQTQESAAGFFDYTKV